MKYLLSIFLFTFLLSCTPKQKPEPEQETKAPKSYSIEEFYKSINIRGGSFSSDESKLLLTSDETGIFNLFEIDIKDGSKKQITFSEKESYYSIAYFPNSNDILYTADKGGNEINHLYLLKPDSSSIDLTPEENAKSSFMGWSQDKKYMYFNSNKRDAKYFDVYKMKIEDFSSELLYQNDEGMEADDISNNENYLVLSKTITRRESKLFLYDRTNDKSIEISNGIASFSASGFSKDDKYLYYKTDLDKEYKYLVEYEIATGERKVKFESNWDVMYSKLSENEKYRVTAINADGKNELKIIDNSNGAEVEFPNLEDGDIKSVSISESEKNIRLSVGTSKTPSNIYVYNFESKNLTKLTESLNQDIDQNDLVSGEVVRYKSFDDLEIPAIYYKPKVASSKNKVPGLVWVHGGPGGQSRVGYRPVIQYLVNNGYAILAVNNRGSSGYGKTFFAGDDRNHGDKDLKDCIWGKKWLQSKDYIDQEKIGILGGSYGGYMTMAAMAFAPDEFKVGVNIFGVTNWLRTLKSIPPYWEAYRKALYDELGDPTSVDSVRLYEISPLFHADKIKNPVMVLQGANDPRVLQVESDEIVAAMKKNNVTVEYIVFPDEGHGFRKKENQIKGYEAIKDFLEKHLK
ncbi:MAG: S9 family peptidase [Aureispira sp.]|nr:S9 family peptidase [Aureispira sp.]